MCPECGETLMWAKGPWRVVNVLAIVAVIVLFTASPVRSVLTAVAILGAFLASFALRLVRVPNIGSRRVDDQAL
jgi:hypothetical protein